MDNIKNFMNKHFVSDELPFASRMLNFVCLIGAAASGIALLWRVIAGAPFASAVPLLLAIAVILGILWLPVKGSRYATALAVVVVCGVVVVIQSVWIVGFVLGFIILYQNRLYLHERHKAAAADSEIRQSEELLTLINDSAVTLLTVEPDRFEAALMESMGNIGVCLDIDCIYIWRVDERDGVSVYVKIYDWFSPNLDKATTYEAVTGTSILPRMRELDDKLLGEQGYIAETVDHFTGFLYDKLSSSDAKAIMAFPVFFQGGYWGFVSFENRHSDKLCSAKGAAILQSGSLLLANVIARNESEKERLDALDRAIQASRAKGDFLSNMSHEIRTPMNAIIGMTAIGMSATDTERMKYCFVKIEDASKHLLGVINDILDISKIEANKLELSPVSFIFEKMLQNIVNIISFRVDEHRQRFFVNIGKDIPPVFIGDDQRLAQVITNLLSNAVKFTPEGGTITLDSRLLSEEDGVCCLQISVEDTGIGISEYQKARLFQSFEQAEAGTTRKYGGTGLGLAISKRIIEMMGGEIWVESEPDKGSRFIFTVVLKRDLSEKAPMLAEGVNWGNIRIFAVDDEPEIREFFKSMADHLGIHCTVAASGEEAAEMLAREDDYDIYFLDWMLPGVNGIELAQQIDAGSARKSIVIIFSSTDWSLIEDDARNAGVDKFLPKPLFPSTLVDLINECIGIERVTGQYHQDETTDDFSEHTILLAEDVEINREIVFALLEPTSIHIEWAENGAEAVRLFSGNPDRYDMIFMDVQMPEMDGYEATRRIRALDLPRAKEIPIVAMTANVFKEDIERCLDAGMNDHVGKPLDLGEVLVMLNRYLKVRDGQSV